MRPTTDDRREAGVAFTDEDESGLVTARDIETGVASCGDTTAEALAMLADAFLIKAYGHSYPLLWPLTAYAPPTPGLYLSTDVWPTIVTGALALGLWVLDRSFN